MIGVDMPSTPLILYCPTCHRQHVDRGEWSVKLHRTHLCEHCGATFRPANVSTVGVEALPEESAWERLVGFSERVVDDLLDPDCPEEVVAAAAAEVGFDDARAELLALRAERDELREALARALTSKIVDGAEQARREWIDLARFVLSRDDRAPEHAEDLVDEYIDSITPDPDEIEDEERPERA